MTKTNKTFEQSVDAGQAVYKPWVLRIYDIVVTHVSNRFIWKCPASKMVALYHKNIGKTHLDIGVGSGYYLQKIAHGVDTLYLMDLNQNALQYAQNRIHPVQCQTIQHDIFKPLPKQCKSYDSIGINYILHCIPGGFDGEKGIAIKNAVSGLKKGGVLFGSTIVCADDKSTKMAHKLMAVYNKKGIFHNTTDTQKGLENALHRYLKDVKTQRIGSVILFSGKKA